MEEPLHIGEFVIHDNEIGRGAFGVVYLATNTATLHRVAAKRISKRAKDKELSKDVEAELISLKKGLKNENVLQMLAFHTDNEFYWFFTELCDTDLDTYMQQNCFSMNYSNRLDIMSQTSSGLCFLHDNNIVHRDIKPTNILLMKKESSSEVVAKIADLGTAKLMPDDQSEMHTFAGTEAFMAPELIETDETGKHSYRRSVDTFSLGLVFLCMEQAKQNKPLKPVLEDPSASVKEVNAKTIAYSMMKRRQNIRREGGGEYIRVAFIQESDGLVKQHVKELINQMTNTEPRHRPAIGAVERRTKQLLEVINYLYNTVCFVFILFGKSLVACGRCLVARVVPNS